MSEYKEIYAPYIMSTVKAIPNLTYEERADCLKKAGYNIFKVKPKDIAFDLFTDSGNSSVSNMQSSSYLLGDDAPITMGESYERLINTISKIFGYQFISLFTQGRAAEQSFNQFIINKDDHILGNMTFSTSQHHQISSGGIPVSVSSCNNLEDTNIFKGNIDLDKCSHFLKTKKVAYINIEMCSNALGGYPISLDNLKQVYELADVYNIPLILDGTRILENAKFIQMYEKGYEEKLIHEIITEICNYSHGCVMSFKKDFLTKNGGMAGLRDEVLFRKVSDFNLVSGQEITGSDQEVLLQGIKEAIYNENHMTYRFNQTIRLYNILLNKGVPVLKPHSGHGVWINLDNISFEKTNITNIQLSFQNLLYLKKGIRVGAETPKINGSTTKLIRLAIPHRLFVESHIDYIGESVAEVINSEQHWIDYIQSTDAKVEGIIENLLCDYEPKLVNEVTQ
ncbi:tryptophanase [Alkalihalophilus lindianensis]|uniref:Tryptophanase n=1 Tax=Alkalihalophilus lindianensis TaxID=1630542 RepID=A0ABU3XBH1_9BACI|nr:tryptophanase [Alkalihalophilus lindianensis]MDV2685198.1 tryptophanase [Alkalihalophilus lindianensis]